MAQGAASLHLDRPREIVVARNSCNYVRRVRGGQPSSPESQGGQCLSLQTPGLTRIGSKLFGYRLDALLGRGGMGVVYKAYDQRLNRYVALKLIAPELSEDKRFRERFLAESELAASLDHPNVVPIHDAFDADGQLAIAMRYVEGTDLRKLLDAERALEPARTLAICGHVARALDAAHAKAFFTGT